MITKRLNRCEQNISKGSTHMKLLSEEEIRNKYKYNYTDTFLHYAIMSGEIPSELITTLGISQNTKKYIVNKSKHSENIIAKINCKRYGYQIHQHEIHLFTKRHRQYQKIINIISNTNVKTSDLQRRTRYRSKAFLLHLLDRVGIEYLNIPIPYKSNGTSNAFYDVAILKQSLSSEPNNQFADMQEYGLKSSRVYGCAVLNNNSHSNEQAKYNIFVFNESLLSLNYSSEIRMTISEKAFFKTDNEINNIIIVKNTKYQNELLKPIYDIIYEDIDVSKYRIKSKYTYLRKSDIQEIHLISFDTLGEQQLLFIANKETIDIAINKKLKSMDDSKETKKLQELKYSTQSDTVYRGIPCYYLYSLDIKKLRRIQIMIKMQNKAVIICFSENKKAIQKTLKNSNEYIEFITLEELNILKELV